MKLNKILFATFMFSALCSQGADIDSPTGKLKVITSVNDEGKPVYSVICDGKTVIDKAPLGLTTDFADLSKGLKETDVKTGVINREYAQEK